MTLPPTKPSPDHQHAQANPSARIVLAGGSGFLGTLLGRHFLQKGWDVVVLTRGVPSGNSPVPGARYVQWDGERQGAWMGELDGASVLINLAGKSVNCRYHAGNRRELVDSRILPTRLLGKVIRQCENSPGIWMNASTATLYRHTYDNRWDEDGLIGPHPDAKDAFSIQLATAWENTFREAETPGVRKILLRSAMVLGSGYDPSNVFAVLRRLTRLGLGGTMGHGKQFVSWIHKTDFCRAVEWLIEHPETEGVVNLSAPNPLPNQEMMRTFRKAFGIPIGLPAPQWLLELGAFFMRTETELIIKSRNVVPRLLTSYGFSFAFPTLPEAIEDLKQR